MDKDKVTEVAMNFIDLLNENYGEGAEIKLVAVVGMVEDEGGELTAPWSSSPDSGPVAAWALHSAANYMEAGHHQNGGK